LRNLEWKREFDLGAGVGLAPDAEVGADVCGSFAHDGEAPVGFAAGVEELRVDACAVVADGYAQFARGIFDFDFDLFGLGMAQGVEKRLAGDQEDLLQDAWVHWFWAPHFCDSQAGAVGGREFILKIGERLLEACGRGIVAAKSFEGGAAFVDSLAHEVADAAQQRLGGGIGRDPALGDLELHGGAEESLQQGVVEFACDASSFEAAFFLKKNVFPGGFMRIGESEISRDSPGLWRNTCSFVCHDRSSLVG